MSVQASYDLVPCKFRVLLRVASMALCFARDFSVVFTLNVVGGLQPAFDCLATWIRCLLSQIAYTYRMERDHDVCPFRSQKHFACNGHRLEDK